jgi:hypothetical protein
LETRVCQGYEARFIQNEINGEVFMKTYKILRFRFKGETTVEKTGLTLKKAQEHCSREDTHGEGWFDGYSEEYRKTTYRPSITNALMLASGRL